MRIPDKIQRTWTTPRSDFSRSVCLPQSPSTGRRQAKRTWTFPWPQSQSGGVLNTIFRELSAIYPVCLWQLRPSLGSLPERPFQQLIPNLPRTCFKTSSRVEKRPSCWHRTLEFVTFDAVVASGGGLPGQVHSDGSPLFVFTRTQEAPLPEPQRKARLQGFLGSFLKILKGHAAGEFAGDADGVGGAVTSGDEECATDAHALMPRPTLTLTRTRTRTITVMVMQLMLMLMMMTMMMMMMMMMVNKHRWGRARRLLSLFLSLWLLPLLMVSRRRRRRGRLGVVASRSCYTSGGWQIRWL